MMSIVLTYLPFIISLWLGFILINTIKPKDEPLPLAMLLIFSVGLGLGISSASVFLSLILLHHLHVDFIVLLNLSLLLGLHILYFLKHKNFSLYRPSVSRVKELIPFALIAVICIPFWVHAHFYVYGGWDAWSVWNLKARFIFLGGNDWTKIFDPLLWRSSPHYPLFLPLTINWGWILQDTPVLEVPIFTAYLFTFLTLALLFVALKELTKSWYSFLCPLVLITLPFYVKLSLSQYADICVSFYVLSSIVCLIFARKTSSMTYMWLAAVFLGILSFTKPEGLAASIVISFLFLPFMIFNNNEFKLKFVWIFYGCLALAFLPLIIFKLLYAPHNLTMINGLTSVEKHVSWGRAKMIFAFFFVELFGFPSNGQWLLNVNWHVTWIVFIVGGLMSFKNAWRKDLLIIPLFLLSYLLIAGGYYYINTYFKIEWWLQVTLHRVLFAILPTFVFWVFVSVWKENQYSSYAASRDLNDNY